jgi:hypothetical protein
MEPADRNKSLLTHKITAAAQTWLDSRGFKPVETEVFMPAVAAEKAWIADLASVIHPTQTELIELRFIPRRPSWRSAKEVMDAWEAKLGELQRQMTCLVEVKSSRSDFTGDRKWNLTPPVDMAFLAIPAGLIRPDEWPDGWGILEFRDDKMVKLRNPNVRQSTVEQRLHVIYQIAIRRDHRTRYASAREQDKQERIERAERLSVNRLSNIVKAVTAITTGKHKWGAQITSVEDALKYYGVRDARPDHLAQLGALLGIASAAGRSAADPHAPEEVMP